MIVVSNASPLITLAKIRRFELPQQLFSDITISHEVFTEVVSQGAGLPASIETQQAGWIHVARLADATLMAVRHDRFAISICSVWNWR